MTTNARVCPGCGATHDPPTAEEVDSAVLELCRTFLDEGVEETALIGCLLVNAAAGFVAVSAEAPDPISEEEQRASWLRCCTSAYDRILREKA